MEELGELALFYLEEVDPRSVYGIDLADVVDTLRGGGFTREEAGAVARWLFACLPPHSSDGIMRQLIDPDHDTEWDVPPPRPFRFPNTIH